MHQVGNRLSVVCMCYNVDMVICDGVAIHRNTMPLHGPSQPLSILVPLLDKLEKETPVMTTVREVVGISFYQMSRGPWHPSIVQTKEFLTSHIMHANRPSKRANRPHFSRRDPDSLGFPWRSHPQKVRQPVGERALALRRGWFSARMLSSVEDAKLLDLAGEVARELEGKK